MNIKLEPSLLGNNLSNMGRGVSSNPNSSMLSSSSNLLNSSNNMSSLNTNSNASVMSSGDQNRFAVAAAAVAAAAVAAYNQHEQQNNANANATSKIYSKYLNSSNQHNSLDSHTSQHQHLLQHLTLSQQQRSFSLLANPSSCYQAAPNQAPETVDSFSSANRADKMSTSLNNYQTYVNNLAAENEDTSCDEYYDENVDANANESANEKDDEGGGTKPSGNSAIPIASNAHSRSVSENIGANKNDDSLIDDMVDGDGDDGDDATFNEQIDNENNDTDATEVAPHGHMANKSFNGNGNANMTNNNNYNTNTNEDDLMGDDDNLDDEFDDMGMNACLFNLQLRKCLFLLKENPEENIAKYFNVPKSKLQ